METQPATPRETDTVFVGRKPTMVYVLACLNLIQNESGGLTIKARGKAIARAVDVAQILTKRFATDIKVQSVSIGTEQIKSDVTQGISDVPSIEIKLQR